MASDNICLLDRIIWYSFGDKDKSSVILANEAKITYPKFRNAACMKKNMYRVKKASGHVTLYNFYFLGAVAKFVF